MYFNITREDLDYLRKRDKRLGAVIDKIGIIERETDGDLFSSVIHQIIGQQISMKAYATVRARVYDYLGEVTPETVAAADTDALQKLGMSRRKAEYIIDFAVKVKSGGVRPRRSSRNVGRGRDLRALIIKGNRRVDSGNASAVLPAKAGHTQLLRRGNTARNAYGLPPQANYPRAV